MKIDDYEIEPYAKGWKLTAWHMGVDKNNNPKRQKRVRFYPTLKQTLESIQDDDAGRLTTAQELKEMLSNTSTQIEQILSRNGLVWV